MGFGIALIGHAFMLFTGTGAEIFAPILLAYGFFLASRLNGKFLHASVSALFMLPRAIVQLLTALGIIELNALPLLNTVTFILNLAAWLIMTFFWLSAVISIAIDCSAEKLERQARNRLVFTVMFILLVLGVRAVNVVGLLGDFAGTMVMVEFFLQYAVIIVNTLFMHTCFILITSERQFERDKQEIAKERAKELEKKQKERQEVAEKLEKHKK